MAILFVLFYLGSATTRGQAALPGQKFQEDTVLLQFRHLDSLSRAQLLTKADLDFIGRHLGQISSKDRLFKWCLTAPAMIDSLIGNGNYAKVVCNNVIYREEIKPAIQTGQATGQEPHWKSIEKNVHRKYGAAFDHDKLLQARIDWYKSRREAQLYAHYLAIQIDRQLTLHQIQPGWMGIWALNNQAWAVFQYDSIKKDLRMALRWSGQVISETDPPSAGYLDTKANLLYKLGKKGAALKLESQAAAMLPLNTDIISNYHKMQAGTATWPDKME